MRILKETELRKVKVLGSGAFGTVYKVRGGAKVRGGRSQRTRAQCGRGFCWESQPRAGGGWVVNRGRDKREGSGKWASLVNPLK